VRARYPDERIYTFWDYFRQHWQKDSGLRIDHLLLSADLAPRLRNAGVDRWVRDRPPCQRPRADLDRVGYGRGIIIKGGLYLEQLTKPDRYRRARQDRNADARRLKGHRHRRRQRRERGSHSPVRGHRGAAFQASVGGSDCSLRKRTRSVTAVVFGHSICSGQRHRHGATEPDRRRHARTF